MSTRGEIGFLMKDGSVYSIYNHCDSYLSGLGSDLFNELTPSKDVLEFVMKMIHETQETILYYKTIEEYANSLEHTDREYLYLWDNGWKALSVHLEGNGQYIKEFMELKKDNSGKLYLIKPNGDKWYDE